MTLQLSLSCATSRFEGCAGGEGRSLDATLAGAIRFCWRTLCCNEGSPGRELLPRSNLSTSTEGFDKMPLSF